MSWYGAPDLPLFTQRTTAVIEPHQALAFKERRAFIRTVVDQMKILLEGTLNFSKGSVGCVKGDGMTEYYDVHGHDHVVWSYYGTDYGHVWQLEVLANTPERLAEILTILETLNTEEMTWWVTDTRMPDRAKS